MPKRVRTPSYRLHKATGQAVVTLDGRDRYLGRYGTAASRAEYDRLISEWLAHRRRLPPSEDSREFTVNELILAFVNHARTYYVKNGAPTSEYDCIRLAVRPVRKLYGWRGVTEFGPSALKTVREVMIAPSGPQSQVRQRADRSHQTDVSMGC